MLEKYDGSNKLARHDRRVAYREYYDGDHATQLSDRQRKYLQIKIGEEFNDNYCPVVIDAIAERLVVTGFDADEISALLWDWWQLDRMDATQGIVHKAAPRDGDAYLLVEWNNELGRPTFSYEPAFDGKDGVEIYYSLEKRDRAEVAAKRWATEEGDRLNLYYPDRVEKYIRRGDGGEWEKYGSELYWTDNGIQNGEPLGIPIVHFRNGDQGYSYGQSELRNIIPLQNALNKSVIDLVAAADTTAFRIYWMIGDDPSNIEITPGSWIYSEKPPSGENGVSIGHIPGEDLSKLIEFKDSFVTEIARVSRTPMSYFQMSRQRPAEGTLKQEESGLIARVKDRQVVFGNAWEDAMLLAARLWNAFGDGEAIDIDDLKIQTIWKDPETRNDKVFLEMLKVKAELKVPIPELWAEMGYDADKIDEMKQSPEYLAYLAQQELSIAALDNMLGIDAG